MKQNILCLFFFSILFWVLTLPFAKADAPLKDKVFVLDAGHGGVDPGTVVGQIYEKDINLKITLALKKHFNELGAKVYLTRDGDYDLGTPKAMYRKKSDFDHRILYINQISPDYYLSIHLNYLDDSSYSGAQVFYSNVLEENKDLASKVQTYLNTKLKTSRDSKKISNTIYMYSKLKSPGILVECGFLSNANERNKLQDDQYIDLLAKYLAEAFL